MVQTRNGHFQTSLNFLFHYIALFCYFYLMHLQLCDVYHSQVARL